MGLGGCFGSGWDCGDGAVGGGQGAVFDLKDWTIGKLKECRFELADKKEEEERENAKDKHMILRCGVL